MAIQRDAQSVDFGVQRQVANVPNAVSFVNPDVDKFKNNDAPAPLEQSNLDALVGLLAKPVYQKAQQEVSTARSEAYLAGAAAAASGQAQDQVESNIITKDWATAGYADTRGRLALADAQAQTAVDMTKLREQSPAEMQKYLADKRAQLSPYLENMSLDARQGFFAQQLTSDRAAIEKHATEHQKFIIDQIGKGVTTDLSVRFDALSQAKTSETAYAAATQDAFAAMYSNIWKNPNLPEKNRVQLTTEAAIAALNQNHQLLYEQMRDQKGEDGLTMLQHLPFDDQVKLAKGYDQSRKDTAAMRLGSFSEQLGLLEASFSDPLQPAMSHNDMQSFIQHGVQLGAVSEQKQASLWQAWAEGNQKKSQVSTLGQAWAVGDMQTMASLGKDDDAGAKAWMTIQARNNAPVQETVGKMMQIGLTTGSDSAFKHVGELVKGPVALIGRTANIDPSQLQVLNTVFSTIDQAEKNGQTGAMSAFLGAFDEQTRAKIMTYREKLQRLGTPDAAAQETADQFNTQSQLTPEQKNATAAAHAQADLKVVQELEPKGLWAQAMEAIRPGFTKGMQASNDLDKLRANKSWFENDERVEQAMAASRTALTEELNYVSRSNPLMSDDARRRVALAAVAQRTMVLDGGPIVLPRIPSGQTKQDYFGVPQSTTDGSIVEALNKLHVASDGNRVVYNVTGTGQLRWQELGSKGEIINPGGVFDPKQISGKIQEIQDERSAEYNRTDGAGVKRTGVTGAAVQYNGNNTYGIDNKLMLDFRDQLVKNEDVRDTAYDDASGKVVNGKRVQTVGVGVSSTNDHFPKLDANGKATQQQINESFMQASNDAAITGAKAQQETGNKSPAAFKLFSELAYQGGSISSDFKKAMATGDTNKALAALHDTPQFKLAHNERKASYDNLVKGALLR